MHELLESVKTYNVFMTEIDQQDYIDGITGLITKLTDDGYRGVYVSFQRPYSDLERHIDPGLLEDGQLHLIDAVTKLERDPEPDDGVTYLSTEDQINTITRAIYDAITEMGDGKRFILIDSLTTMTLYKPLSETMRLAEFLIKTIDLQGEDIILIFNVAGSEASREFVRDIAFRVDEVVTLDD